MRCRPHPRLFASGLRHSSRKLPTSRLRSTPGYLSNPASEHGISFCADRFAPVTASYVKKPVSRRSALARTIWDSNPTALAGSAGLWREPFLARLGCRGGRIRTLSLQRLRVSSSARLELHPDMCGGRGVLTRTDSAVRPSGSRVRQALFHHALPPAPEPFRAR